MTLNEFWEEIEKNPVENYIVTLKYKYDHETEYIVENQILEVDIQENPYPYVWLNDWNEGQTDIEVVSYIAVSDVDTTRHTGDLVSRQYLLDEYDRLHVGPPGKARKIIEDAPSAQVDKSYELWKESYEVLKEEYDNLTQCDDCISRQAAIKVIEAIPDGNWKSVRYSKEILRLPSVTPNGVPDINVGKWIPHKSVFGGLGEKVYTCDRCGHNIGFHTENFCPSCGAIMNLPSADLSSYSDKLYQKAYEQGKAEEQKEPCWVCEGLENGDTLYSMSDWDGGIGFDYIRDIEYCPLCGRKL